MQNVTTPPLTSTVRMHLARASVVAGLSAALAFGCCTPLAFACTQVFMGGGTTSDGYTYVGRNEDYAPRKPKVFGIQERQKDVTYTSEDAPMFKLKIPGETARYTYIRDHKNDGWDGNPYAYSEAGVNEYGVSASATLTADYNDAIQKVDPVGQKAGQGKKFGIGEFNLVDVILGHSKTARDGVKLLGDVIDKHGAFDPNLILISDNKESWIFQMLSGHQWVAFRASHLFRNQVSVAPNTGRLEYDIDLTDTENVLHSKDIVTKATAAKSAKYFKNGHFNIAASYGAETPRGTTSRYIQGRAYFNNPLAVNRYTYNPTKKKSPITDPELMFNANRSITTFDALRSLATRGEETKDFNTNTNKKIYPIANHNDAESHMFQLRFGMPAQIATIQWTMLSRPEFNVSIPAYSALLTKLDDKLYPTMDNFYLDYGDDKMEDDNKFALQDKKTDALDYTMMDIYTLVDNNRAKFAAPVHAYFDALQKEVISEQTKVDSIMRRMVRGRESTDALQDFANKAHKTISNEVATKARAVLAALRASTTDTTKPFVIDDFDASAKALKAHLTYAQAMGYTAPATSSWDADDIAEAEAAHATVAMYRLYNKWTHEHLFTTDKAEYDSLVAAGWTGEGEIDSVATKEGKGVYRLYNPYTHEHHYTADENELAKCVKDGWKNEGIKFHSVQNGTIPVYSMYNPNEKKFYHHYTSNPDEIAKMVKDGWIKEEIKWYAAPKK